MVVLTRAEFFEPCRGLAPAKPAETQCHSEGGRLQLFRDKRSRFFLASLPVLPNRPKILTGEGIHRGTCSAHLVQQSRPRRTFRQFGLDRLCRSEPVARSEHGFAQLVSCQHE
jgi:hypothetical protein